MFLKSVVRPRTSRTHTAFSRWRAQDTLAWSKPREGSFVFVRFARLGELFEKSIERGAEPAE